ncbi:hypothetical protein NXU92_07065 [Bacteroides fragilis]|nr:hypothetical protein [Bacteroides fragilis]
MRINLQVLFREYKYSSFSGAPGATTSVRIRGMGSMNAGNDPLYVIDGSPVQSGNASAFNTPNTGKD